MDARIADLLTRVIASTNDPARYQATDEERREMYAGNMLEAADTSVATMSSPARIGENIHAMTLPLTDAECRYLNLEEWPCRYTACVTLT